ncbi:MAG: hypothetical protein ACXW5U_13820 [Thermoanaerobaculia bacterium]
MLLEELPHASIAGEFVSGKPYPIGSSSSRRKIFDGTGKSAAVRPRASVTN